jgi:hypothetical protein
VDTDTSAELTPVQIIPILMNMIDLTEPTNTASCHLHESCSDRQRWEQGFTDSSTTTSSYTTLDYDSDGCNRGIRTAAMNVATERVVVDHSDPFGLYRHQQQPPCRAIGTLANCDMSRLSNDDDGDNLWPCRFMQGKRDRSNESVSHKTSHSGRCSRLELPGPVDNRAWYPELVIRLDDCTLEEEEDDSTYSPSFSPTTVIHPVIGAGSFGPDDSWVDKFSPPPLPERVQRNQGWSTTTRHGDPCAVSCKQADSPRNHYSRHATTLSNWHQLVANAAWSQWHDELQECLQQRLERRHCVLSDEVLLDPHANTTLLHVAAWKAPPTLMLLLLQVVTTCGGGGGDRATTSTSRALI